MRDLCFENQLKNQVVTKQENRIEQDKKIISQFDFRLNEMEKDFEEKDKLITRLTSKTQKQEAHILKMEEFDRMQQEKYREKVQILE